MIINRIENIPNFNKKYSTDNKNMAVSHFNASISKPDTFVYSSEVQAKPIAFSGFFSRFLVGI